MAITDETFAAMCAEKWTTAQGQTLTWEQMSDSHLLNCAALIERRHAEQLSAAAALAVRVQGEMAQDAVDSEMERMGEAGEEVRIVAAAMRRFVELRKQINRDFERAKAQRINRLLRDTRFD
jgi:hypothetical protein